MIAERKHPAAIAATKRVLVWLQTMAPHSGTRTGPVSGGE